MLQFLVILDFECNIDAIITQIELIFPFTYVVCYIGVLI